MEKLVKNITFIDFELSTGKLELLIVQFWIASIRVLYSPQPDWTVNKKLFQIYFSWVKYLFSWLEIAFISRQLRISCQNNFRSIMCYDILFFKILKFLTNVIISALSLKVFKRVQNIFWKKNREKKFYTKIFVWLSCISWC